VDARGLRGVAIRIVTRRERNCPGPILIGLTREEAQKEDYVTGLMTPLFVWRDFVLCFSPVQQGTLNLVCEHLKDADIAVRLGIGEDASEGGCSGSER
jgi:hypothetical protein